MKHTPAPWKVQNLMQNWHGHEGWNTFTIRDAKTNVCLAVVGEVDRYCEDQNEANARLIAAAPELLEALEAAAQIMVTFGMTFPSDWSKSDQKVLNAARAAIAKAKGE